MIIFSSNRNSSSGSWSCSSSSICMDCSLSSSVSLAQHIGMGDCISIWTHIHFIWLLHVLPLWSLCTLYVQCVTCPNTHSVSYGHRYGLVQSSTLMVLFTSIAMPCPVFNTDSVMAQEHRSVLVHSSTLMVRLIAELCLVQSSTLTVLWLTSIVMYLSSLHHRQ